MDDWKEAKEHLDAAIEAYESIPAGIFALKTYIYPLQKRYKNGERTHELYTDIMEISI